MYRIVTECVNRPGVHELCQNARLDFTSYTGTGCYKGQLEECLILEFCEATREDIEALARRIGQANRQECILIQEIAADSTLYVIR